MLRRPRLNQKLLPFQTGLHMEFVINAPSEPEELILGIGT